MNAPRGQGKIKRANLRLINFTLFAQIPNTKNLRGGKLIIRVKFIFRLNFQNLR